MQNKIMPPCMITWWKQGEARQRNSTLLLADSNLITVRYWVTTHYDTASARRHLHILICKKRIQQCHEHRKTVAGLKWFINPCFAIIPIFRKVVFTERLPVRFVHQVKSAPHPPDPSLYLSPRGGEHALPSPSGRGIGWGWGTFSFRPCGSWWRR